MKLFLILISGLMAGTVHASDFKQRGEGLPLPWPFPWAKECPVNWASMEGRYTLEDDSSDEQIDLKITILTQKGMRMVRLSRYSQSGALISDGFSFVSTNQKMIRLYLYPRHRNEAPIWALIKLHHWSWDLGCSEDQLVPILTLEKTNSHVRKQSQYRLIRVSSKNR